MGEFSRKLFGWDEEKDNNFSNTFRTVGAIVFVIVVIAFIL